MHSFIQFNRLKFILTSLIVLMFTWIGCASPTHLASSQRVPAAQGIVETEVTENGNTRLELEVKHLANPKKIDARANTFVVWVQPRSGEVPKNLGALKVDENLKGTIETITPLRNFELFVTAEPSALVEYPSGSKLLWTDIIG